MSDLISNKVEGNLDFIKSHPLVSRVEVIGASREFVKYGIDGISISFQDDGKTLKVFLGKQTGQMQHDLFTADRSTCR